MDEPLTAAPAARVLHRIAETVLRAPVLTSDLGTIRLVSHQLDAAGRILPMLERHGGALLADATGMGKTYVALAVARMLGTTTIVAPAALRSMWRDALSRASMDARILSYEELSRSAADGHDEPPALLILDEAHHVRNPETHRYRAVASLAWGTRVLLLSATPLHNHLRDLQSLLALFLGSAAWSAGIAAAQAYVVRRAAGGVPRRWGADHPAPLPFIEAPRWLAIAPDESLLESLRSIPPAVPPADGGVAHGLLTLGLIRAWCSSTAALRGMLRRRQQRGIALLAALEEGRHLTHAELTAWTVVDDAVQLALPGLVSAIRRADAAAVQEALQRHLDGIARVMTRLTTDTQDDERAARLGAVLDAAGSDPVVAFTQFTDTALALYRMLSPRGGVALVTGRGARIASGRIGVDEVVRRFDVAPAAPDDPRMPLRLLVASDVLSEGVSLRRARVLVHLDLPWTVARLEQRVGRIRRLGSPHRRITVFSIGPPANSRRLTSVVRALRRKARLTSTFDGSGAHGGPIAGIHLWRLSRRVMTEGDTQAAEALRAMLSTWVGTSDVATAPNGIAGLRYDPRPAEPAWAALALVRHGRAPALLAVTAAGTTDRPAEVLPLARIIDAARTRPAGTGRDDRRPDVSPAIARNVAARIGDWMAAQNGRGLVAAATDAPSPAHGGVLRFLDGLVADAPRTELPAVLETVARCRAAVLAARGMGAEAALARWLEAHQGEPRETDSLVAVTELATELERRGSVVVRDRGRTGSILAVLVLQPRSRPELSPTPADDPPPDDAVSARHRSSCSADRPAP